MGVTLYQSSQIVGYSLNMILSLLLATVLLAAVEGSYYGYGDYGYGGYSGYGYPSYGGYGGYGDYGYGYGDYGYGYGYPSYGYGYGYGHGYGHGHKYKRSTDHAQQQVHMSGNVYGGPVVGAPASAYGAGPAYYPSPYYGYPRYGYSSPYYYPYACYPVHQRPTEAYAPVSHGYGAVNHAVATPFMYSRAQNYGPYGELYVAHYWPKSGM